MDNKVQYRISAFNIGQTKNGKEMWRITFISLKDDKPLTGVIWSEDIPRFDGKKFKVGNVVTFLGQDYNSNYNSVVVKNVTVVKEALPGLPEELTNKYLKAIVDFLNQVKQGHSGAEAVQPELAVLAEDMLTILNNKKFATTPAAVYHHHNYLGGLLKHTYEVWQITKLLIKMFPVEHAEEAQLAAILHDFGKIHEYKTDLELGTAEVDKEWLINEISHTFWGYNFAHDCGAYRVARMVGAHHGRIEWGAMIEPETPEEHLVHNADMLSATVGITTIESLEKQLSAYKAKEEAKKEVKEESNVHPHSDDIL